MKVKLAEALLRRKELQAKVKEVANWKVADVFKREVQRVSKGENFDEITVATPMLKLPEVMAEYNYYAKQLRMIDAIIQQTNWTAEIDAVTSDGMNLMADFPVTETA